MANVMLATHIQAAPSLELLIRKTGMSYLKLDRLIGLIVLSLCLVGFSAGHLAQTHRRQSAKAPIQTSTKPKVEPSPSPSPINEQPPVETIKVDTNLVTVPVVVTDANGRNVANLHQEDFVVAEDGKPQQIALFATTRLPVNVVLLLDTSASTKDKLTFIQSAAIAFVERLESHDRVKVISFDSRVRELSNFSSDRATLKAAINSTTPGEGTKLYDAIDLALSGLRKLQGRKAIVLFSDGVDWHSDQASDFTTLNWLDEAGVTIYPIRYDTRAITENILRGAEANAPPLPTIDVVRKSQRTTTEPTFPGDDDPGEGPPMGQPRKTGPLGLPTADEILKGGRRREPGDPSSQPPPTPPSKPKRGTASKTKPETVRRGRHGGDPVTEMLNRMYVVADKYLADLAEKSGGIVLRVDDLSTLPDAFAQVAAELQLQYVIGYYPLNKSHDGEYRNISVTIPRQQVTIRARPGYRSM